MKRKITCSAIILLCVISTSFSQSVDWTSGTEGSMNGISISLTNINDATTASYDFSSPEFSASPLSVNTDCIDYAYSSDWTATFNQTVSSVKLYMLYWRGFNASVNPVIYTFDQNFTILSGLSGVSSDGNSLSIPDDIWGSGIIEFDGNINSLTVDVNDTGISRQLMTFSYLASSSAESIDQSNILIYPNPTYDKLYIKSIEDFQFIISDINGKIVMNQEQINTSESESYDISKLESGVYVIKLQTDGDVYTKKIIKR